MKDESSPLVRFQVRRFAQQILNFAMAVVAVLGMSQFAAWGLHLSTAPFSLIGIALAFLGLFSCGYLVFLIAQAPTVSLIQLAVRPDERALSPPEQDPRPWRSPSPPAGPATSGWAPARWR